MLKVPAMLTLQDVRTEIDSSQGIVVAVDGVSFAIRPGETFALVGESGSGKSVTALSIARLLPDNACTPSGDIRLGEVNLVELAERDMRSVRGRRISMIFQEPATSLNPVMTVGDQIVEVIEIHTALRGAAARARAIEWLGRVGIPEPERRINSYPFQMSGGQKQRVMIAVALAAEPELLIADEPTTALDVTVQKQILDLLKDLQRERNMAILLITHDLGVVAQVADRVGLMYAGQMVELASTASFFARPLHPYAERLLAALPDTAKRDRPLDAIAGSVPPLNQVFGACRFAPRCHAVGERCQHEVPDMYSASSDHTVRCFIHAPTRAVVATPLTLAPTAASTVRTPVGDTPVLLDVAHLRVRFPIRAGLLRRVVGHIEAVKGISFQVREGQTLALVGESGCGKTTSGKAIVQLLRQSAVVDGHARLGTLDLMQAQGSRLLNARSAIQIIFQDPYGSLNPRMRIGEILEEGLLSLRGDIDAASRTARISRLIDHVGLPQGALQKYPHEFSGGQRQRIAIARALAVEPRLIVCDEPTSALDVSVQAQILNLLKQLQDELGVAYLFITHNIGVVEYLAQEVAVMKSGQIVEAGPAAQVLQHPAHSYTQTLLDAVPRVG